MCLYGYIIIAVFLAVKTPVTRMYQKCDGENPQSYEGTGRGVRKIPVVPGGLFSFHDGRERHVTRVSVRMGGRFARPRTCVVGRPGGYWNPWVAAVTVRRTSIGELAGYPCKYSTRNDIY